MVKRTKVKLEWDKKVKRKKKKVLKGSNIKISA